MDNTLFLIITKSDRYNTDFIGFESCPRYSNMRNIRLTVMFRMFWEIKCASYETNYLVYGRADKIPVY